MSMLLVCWWFIVVINVYCRSEFLTKLTEYLSDDLKLDRVNLIVDSPGSLSAKAVLIIERLIDTLPSIVVSGRELSSSEFQNHQIRRTMQVLSKPTDYNTLKILIIDVRFTDEIERILVEYMNLFAQYPPDYKRSKCLIISINQAGSLDDMMELLKHSWSLNFLYVTLIDVKDVTETNNRLTVEKEMRSEDVTVHHYNPFRNYSYKLPFLEDHRLFNNKLKNLYGYPLKVGFYESIPLLILKRNHPINQTLTDDLYGVDLIVSKTLSAKMNFSLFVKMNSSGTTPRIMFKVLRNNSVDFFMNIFTTTGFVNPEENINTMSSIFMQQYGHKLLLKQQGYYEIKYLWYLFTVAIIAAITLACCALLCFLPFNRRSWNVYTVSLMLLGITPAMNLRRSSDRIFYLGILFISLIVSVELLNNLLSNMLVKKKFRLYETIEDVVENNMIIGLARALKPMFAINSHIDKLFDLSMDVNNFEGETGCAESLISESKPVNGCDVNNVMADFLSKSYSDPNAEWTLGTLTGADPFGIGMTWTTLPFAHSSVYVEECNLILRRLLEAGLIAYWRNTYHANWYFKRSRSVFSKDKSFQFKNPVNSTHSVLEYKRVELNTQMIGILVFGYGISSLVFLFEIIWRTFRTRQVRGRKP